MVKRKTIKGGDPTLLEFIDVFSKKNKLSYFSYIHNKLFYLYIVCEDSKKYDLITLLETKTNTNTNTETRKTYRVVQQGSYLEIIDNNKNIVANIIHIPPTIQLPEFTDNNKQDNMLFMHLYEKSKRISGKLNNSTLDSIIETLLVQYNDTQKKQELLLKYKDSDNKTFILLVNYLYPEFHNELQDKIIKILEESIIDFSIDIQKDLDLNVDKTSKIVLIGGASVNIVTNKTESINDFDFTIYSKKQDTQLYDKIVNKCKLFQFDFSHIKQSPNKNSVHRFDIKNIKFKDELRINKIHNVISIDLLIPETFIIDEKDYTNEFTLPIIDITFKVIDEKVYDNISVKCELLKGKQSYKPPKLFNILSPDELKNNILNMNKTLRTAKKKEKDIKRLLELEEIINNKTTIYTYNLRKLPSLRVSALDASEAAANALRNISRNPTKIPKIPNVPNVPNVQSKNATASSVANIVATSKIAAAAAVANALEVSKKQKEKQAAENAKKAAELAASEAEKVAEIAAAEAEKVAEIAAAEAEKVAEIAAAEAEKLKIERREAKKAKNALAKEASRIAAAEAAETSRIVAAEAAEAAASAEASRIAAAEARKAVAEARKAVAEATKERERKNKKSNESEESKKDTTAIAAKEAAKNALKPKSALSRFTFGLF